MVLLLLLWPHATMSFVSSHFFSFNDIELFSLLLLFGGIGGIEPGVALEAWAKPFVYLVRFIFTSQGHYFYLIEKYFALIGIEPLF